MTSLTIRPATIADTDLILHFVRELAIYEKPSTKCWPRPRTCTAPCFATTPRCFGLICLDGDTPVGFAVYFFNYSTWQGQHGLYLEDLYVSPEQRGKGAGKALLSHLAKIAWTRLRPL